MAVGLANGFLFLGGGSQTFSTDNASIAALMIAMFPRFPSTTSDNRWHCQAYRHLYVLAARPRLLQTVDATTLDAVSTPLEMTCTVKGKEITTKLITPCLLPDPSSLVRIRLISPRYWPLTLDFSDGRDDAKKKLYALRRVPIQRHTGALSYEVDRTGAKAQLATALHAAGAKAALKPSTSAFFEQNTAPVANATAAQAGKDAVDVFTSDVTLLAFSHAMCDGSSDRAGFTAAALRECMEREVPEALRAYVDLYASCESLTHASSTSHEEFATQASLAVSDLRLLDAFNAFITRKSAITKEQSTNVSPVPELLSASFRRSVLLSLEGAYGDSALARYLRGQGYDASADARGAFGCYLRLLDMPNPKVLRHAMESGGAGATTSASAVRARLPHLAPSAVLRIIEACLEVVEEEYA
jgi:anaphase-promoting complex subunit 1